MSTLTYNGYTGTVEYDDQAEIFHGEVLLTRGVVTFQGRSVKELKKAFQDSVDEYVAFCAESSIAPERAFKGSLSLRLKPELHRAIALKASVAKQSINEFIQRLLMREAAYA